MKATHWKSSVAMLVLSIILLVLAAGCSKSTKQDQDRTPPEVTLTYPLDGWVITGTITVIADASDASGVEKVEFYLDGQLKYTDTSPTWEYILDCTTLADSTQHTLYAKAYDVHGNVGKSDINSVMVKHAVEPPRPTGLVFTPDETYYSIPIAPPPYAGTLPSSVDLTNHMPAVGNQGAQSSCVGWAVGYALKTYQESVERGWNRHDESHVFSPSYIYNQIKTGGCESGSTLPDAFNVLTSQGCASIATMPYNPSDCDAMPSADAIQEASSYKIEYWRRVNLVDPIEVKNHLAGGFPVVLGIVVYENFFYLGPEDVYDEAVGWASGGHAVCLTGYDDSKPAFQIINSWGTGWGDHGYGWIAYAFLPTVCVEAFVAKDLSQEETDTTAPGPISDLTAIASTATSVTLAWTAPGDDGNTGTASEYDIRYSTSTITSSNWNSATECTGEPTPKSAGSFESFTVTGLSSNTTYYFAIKTADEVSNWSGLSNVTIGTTPPPTDTPPASVTDLTTSDPTSSSIKLSWTAPGDNGNTGTASEYDIRYSTSTITTSNWNSATPCTGEPTPKSAGSFESFTVTGLSSNTTYYFAIKTADEVPNWSGLSNVPHEKTLPPADVTPPDSVDDLATSNPTSNSIRLTWTAPGDDGNTGTASQYDIRYSTSTITSSNWNSATECTGEQTPNLAGSPESFTVTGLNSNTTYYFAMKTADEVPNWSGLSNVPTGITLKIGGFTTYNSSNSGLPFNRVIAIAIDASGNKWFGTSEGLPRIGYGVSKFDGTNWTTYNTSNSGLADDIVYAIAIDASGNKWFGTHYEGVSKFDGTNWTTYNTSNSGLSGGEVRAIAIDASGNKWFGTCGTRSGVSKFDGTNWTTYDTSNSGLPDDCIYVIAIDASGNKWFGTHEGVSKFHEED